MIAKSKKVAGLSLAARRPSELRIRKLSLSALLIGSLLTQSESMAAPMESAKKAQLILQATAFAITMFPKIDELIARLPSEADRTYLRRKLGDERNRPIQIKYLERNTLLFWSGKEQFPVEYKDLASGQISIFKHDFVFKQGESAEAAISRMQKTLAQNGRMNLLLPEANAFPWALTGRLSGRFLAWLYVSSVTAFGITCATEGWNSVKTCILDSPKEVDDFVMVASLGLVLMAANSSDRYLRGKLAEKSFDLEDLTCKTKDQPLRAKVTDSSKASTVLELSYKGDTPDHLDFKSGDQVLASVYLKEDGSAAPERVPKGVMTFDDDGADVIAQAAWSLNKFCADGNSAAALARYRKMRDDKYSMKVTPDTGSDQPTATVK